MSVNKIDRGYDILIPYQHLYMNPAVLNRFYLSDGKADDTPFPSLLRVRGPANGGTVSPSVALDLGHPRLWLN